ncbi:Pyrrolidone-carboxylate peptidase [Bacillus manliponensis]
MKTVLVIGFDPFGGEKVNPAWEVAKRLNKKCIGEYTIFSKQLPTVFHKSIQVLQSYIEEIQPSIIICIGQAGGRAGITVERVAINIDDARIPDNEGNQPIDVPVVKGGPAAYFSTLPIKSIVKQLRENRIPASVSQTAGTFVCNHVFYYFSQEYSFLKEREGCSPVSRWEMNWLRTRDGFFSISIVRLFECYL